jgi:hypothetical protein
MGDERDTTSGEVVYLLTELRSEERGYVHEIGSQARVLDAQGDRVRLAVGRGNHEEIVMCHMGLVGHRRRTGGTCRPTLRTRATA